MEYLRFSHHTFLQELFKEWRSDLRKEMRGTKRQITRRLHTFFSGCINPLLTMKRAMAMVQKLKEKKKRWKRNWRQLQKNTWVCLLFVWLRSLVSAFGILLILATDQSKTPQPGDLSVLQPMAKELVRLVALSVSTPHVFLNMLNSSWLYVFRFNPRRPKIDSMWCMRTWTHA